MGSWHHLSKQSATAAQVPESIERIEALLILRKPPALNQRGHPWTAISRAIDRSTLRRSILVSAGESGDGDAMREGRRGADLAAALFS